MRPFFIGLSISLGFSINPLVMAQHAGPKIQNAIHNFDFQKEDIESLIHHLLMKDEISDVQATDALLRLGELSDDEIKHLTMDAFQNFQNFEEEELSALSQIGPDETTFYFDSGIDSQFDIECLHDEDRDATSRPKSKKFQ